MSWSLFNSDEGNMAFNKDNSFFCICNDEIVKKISSYKYFYAPDGTIIDIKDYKVCGFVNEDDGVESARGSVFAIKVDQFTAKHQFYESEYEGVNKVKVNGKYCSTAGYGFSDGEMQITLVDINEIRNTDKSINVHRVYLKDKKITIVKVEGDNQKVVETISYEEPCKCSETVSPHYLRSFFQLTENEKSQVKEKAKILIKTDKSYSYLSWGNLTALVDKFTNEVNSIKESTDKREAYYKNFLDERLVDKLKTYELMNPERRIFIIPMNINQFSSSCIFWNLLSERVFAKSGLKCGDILITIPYVKIKEITGNTTGNYYMPSVESIDCVDIEYDEIAKRSNIGPVIADGKISGEIQDFILDVFTWISKKVLEYHGYYYAHNDQITISKWDNKGEEVSGKSYNCNVFLHQQSDVPSIIAQNKEFESEYSRKFWLSVFSSFTAGQQAKYSNMVTEEEIKSVTEAIRRAEAQYEEAYEYKKKKMLEVIKLIEDLAEQGNDFANYSPKGFVPKFKEEFIDSPNTTLNLQNPDGTICNNAESYIRTEAFNEIRKDLGITEEPDFDYDKSHFHNTTREYLSYYMRDASPYVYGALDVTSVILGFWGLDPIADALGVAYAVVVLDEDQAASYSMNLVVMGPTGVLATKAVTGLKKGANYIRVKYAKDTELVAEILDKNQLGDKALMMIAEDYKTKNIISEEGFNRLSKFKGDDLDEAIKAELRRSEGAASEVKKADDAASESKKADDAANESKKADDAANEAKKQKLPAEYVDDFCNKGDLIKGNKEKRNEIKNELTKKFETFHDGGKQICEDFIDASRAVTGRKTLLNDLKNFDRWKEMYEYRIPDVYRKNVKFYSIWDDVKNFPDPTKIFKDFEDNPAPFLEIVKKGEGKLFVDRWKALNDLRVPDQFRKDPFFVDLWGDEAKVLIKEGKIANVNTTIYVKDFIEGALGEVLSYTLAYAIMNDKINITDFSKDVLRAGYINAIKPSGVFKNYMNCVQNMDIDKLQNILKDIIHGETYTLAIDILHQIFDCASGWIFGSDVFKKNLSKVRDFLLSNPEAYAKALRKIFPKEARFISRYILELADDKDIFEIIPQSVKNKLNSVIGNAYHKFRGKGTDILYYVKYSESEVGVGFIVDFAQDQIFRTFYIKAGKAFDTIDGNIELINEKNEIKNFFDLVEEVKEVVVNLK
ncbi:MAG: hypothetical protein U0K66_08840 [Paludibacteraceae bacterium]|nr:hypothetical protein [Paludibacteraceae bacterium]